MRGIESGSRAPDRRGAIRGNQGKGTGSGTGRGGSWQWRRASRPTDAKLMIQFIRNQQVEMQPQADQIPESLLARILNLVSLNQYDDALKIFEAVPEKVEFCEFYGALVASARSCLPSSRTTIAASSSISHPAYRGDICNINKPSQFIFHTNDSSPVVAIDLAEPVNGKRGIFLYNRCHSNEISKRIVGCDFAVSSDGINWEEVDIVLDDEQIFSHKSIPIITSTNFRYLKITREAHGGGVPIHLSQITIGTPLVSTANLSRFITKVFGHIYNIQVAEGWKFIEDDKNRQSMCFYIHDLNTTELSLELSFVGRFSNFVHQITNAIHFARVVGARTVYLPDTKRVRDLFPEVSTILCNGVPPITIQIGSIRQGISLQGGYFYRHKLPTIYSGMPSMRSLIEPISNKCFQELSQGGDTRELTIHIRSGDIFDNQTGCIHPGYGQPPFAFYKMAIQDYLPEVVRLVFENKLNPVIDEVERFLCSSSINYRIQSSSNLRDDLQCLVSAKALVIGNGTFAHGVICLNKNIQCLYTFNKPFPKSLLPEETRQSATCKVVSDKKGEYTKHILSNNWENTSDQRHLMLSYKEDYLSFD